MKLWQYLESWIKKAKLCKKTSKIYVNATMLGMNLVFKFTWQNNLYSIVDINEKSRGNLNSCQGNVREFCFVQSV